MSGPDSTKLTDLLDSDDSIQRDDKDASNGKSKRRRIPAEKLIHLQALFETTDTPSYEVREELASKLDMTNREVQVWFQNRRAKLNRLRHHKPDGKPDRTSIVAHFLPVGFGERNSDRPMPTPIQVPRQYGPPSGPATAPLLRIPAHPSPLRSPLRSPHRNFPYPHSACEWDDTRHRGTKPTLPSIRELGLDAHLPSLHSTPSQFDMKFKDSLHPPSNSHQLNLRRASSPHILPW